jgi:hypothetical protein
MFLVTVSPEGAGVLLAVDVLLAATTGLVLVSEMGVAI